MMRLRLNLIRGRPRHIEDWAERLPRRAAWHGATMIAGQIQAGKPPFGGSVMSIVFNILLLALVFVVLKTLQIIFDFAYTTYKSVTIHKNWEHAFNPGLSYRLKRGLVGDIIYFIAGIVVAVNADAIRSMIAG
jgi:hypothetical protein